MFAKTLSATLAGIDAIPVEVEVHITPNAEVPATMIVGLPDTAVKESRERVRSAIASCDFPFPQGSTLINLAPADLKKEGAISDLSIALCILAASGIVDPSRLQGFLFAGELALDGSIRRERRFTI